MKNISQLHNTLDQLQAKAAHNLASHHPQAWQAFRHEEKKLEHFVHESEQMAAAGALSGALMLGGLSADALAEFNYTQPVESEKQTVTVQKPAELKSIIIKRALRNIIPDSPQKLDTQTAELVSQKIKTNTGITAVSKLDGRSLNTDYGFMGSEQHLPRFPGDTVQKHDMYWASGITPRKGAFGYFANSESALTKEGALQEKYYVAVQSFLSPQWDGSGLEYKNWIKFRKVLVINPNNGNTLVAAIGDAGPATWTGKQFGGSPEVTHYLNNGQHTINTPVLLLFIDDQENTVPLGPIN